MASEHTVIADPEALTGKLDPRPVDETPWQRFSPSLRAKLFNSWWMSADSFSGKLLRLPLRLLPRRLAVPILIGELRGRRWVVGAGIHGCWIGSYEYDKQRLVRRIVRPGSVFYDLGANAGFYSILASACVGMEGKVYAFEPLPVNLKFLREHVLRNAIPNVEVFECAVSDRDGAAMFEEASNPFMGRLSSAGKVPVQTRTIDALVSERSIAPPHCIKMDIEGAELRALLGARSCLQQYRPVIVLATHGRDIHRECCQLLNEWDYVLQSVGPKNVQETSELLAVPRHSPLRA